MSLYGEPIYALVSLVSGFHLRDIPASHMSDELLSSRIRELLEGRQHEEQRHTEVVASVLGQASLFEWAW